MILYVTSPERVNQFDRVIGEEVMNKYVGEYRAGEFLLKDFPKLGHFEVIILGLDAFADTEDEFVEAIKGFREVSDTRVILYAPMIKTGERLLKRFIEIGIYNIIVEEEYEEFKEIAEKVIKTPMTKEEALRLLGEVEVEPITSGNNEFVFLNNQTQITVTGMGTRVGTTTVVLNLAYNLTKKGAKVGIVFFNKDDKLKDIAEEYHLKELKERMYEKEGMILLSSSVTISNEFEDLNFIILDIGAFTEEKINALQKAKKNIIVSYSKKADIKSLQSFLEEYPELEASILMRSTEDTKRDVIKKSIENNAVYYMDYVTSYFDCDANDEAYCDILSDYIIKRKN
ncbi:MAG: hypothetical protein Q4A29_07760 [Eubacteriales bacterium]|nr:hypothetical protein [Eubacteriales bacterium]